MYIRTLHDHSAALVIEDSIIPPGQHGALQPLINVCIVQAGEDQQIVYFLILGALVGGAL